MRRMYSEQELTKIVEKVSKDYIDELIEGGEFDDEIADYVDAYLVEHPVDITALEGKTIAPAVVNATTSVNAPAVVGTSVEASTSIKYLQKIIDANGNHVRFGEGNGAPATISGMTASYYKWSLSGTHLMLVLAGTLDDATTIGNNTDLCVFELPEWIMAKIYPVFGNAIEVKSIVLRASDWSAEDNPMNIALLKSTYALSFRNLGSLTTTASRGFRIEFDLVIDLSA